MLLFFVYAFGVGMEVCGSQKDLLKGGRISEYNDDKVLIVSPCRITTWALEEARRRLEAEGILEDPHPENK